MHKYRTHTCNDLSAKDVGSKVRLSGWVFRKRDHGNLLFIDLRDHYGVTQIVFFDNLEVASNLKYESVITITGSVLKRSQDTINKSISTGEIEVKVEEFVVESEALVLPILVNQEGDFPESTRLKYRFLDLRREKLHSNIILRSKIISYIRKYLTDAGFNEFQTPILTASSPEGARDFLVPSRLNPGKFYALPQAPQQFKQLLMISGFDKYFQIAPCFRDEDARADRSPGEFYQLDMEMSFVTQEDVFSTVEKLVYSVFKNFSDYTITSTPFPRISFDTSMLKYGSDKPDLRNPIEIVDATEIFENSGFSIFANNIKKGEVVRAIAAPSTSENPRSFFDKKVEFAIANGAKGLAYIIFDENGQAKGPIAKLLDADRLSNLKKIAHLKNGDSVFFTCGEKLVASSLAGKIRTLLGQELGLIEKNIFKFCWITDFPFYEWNEDEGKIDFSHNPFSMPQGGLKVLQDAKTKEDLLKIKAFQYDIVCNGIELSSGAIRNHLPEIMYKAFEIVGYDKDAVDSKFGGMIRAFSYGAPPHGGIAPGIDRMVMLIANEPNIREVIAFPLNQNAQDLLLNAPNTVSEKQLRELNLQLSPKAKALIEKEV